MLLFPYFVGLNQIEMSERARDRHCCLLSLVNFGAFTSKWPQRKQVRTGRTGREQLASEYIYTRAASWRPHLARDVADVLEY